MDRRFLLLAVFVLLFAFRADAQNTTPRADDPQLPNNRFPKKADQDINLPEEMRIRMMIEREENEHRKSIENAEKLYDLSVEVAKGYHEHGHLSAEEIKKVGTIEKLAKRVLVHAGGDEIEDKSGKTGQLSVADAVEHLSEAAANIKKSMKAETRFVVSAAVIANSNEVISLAQLIRRSQKQSD